MTRTYIHREDLRERVHDALVEAGPDGLTKPELMDAANLASSQARRGWRMVKYLLGPTMAVCRPVEGRGWVYRVTDDVQPGLLYETWQVRHARKRTATLLASVRQLRELQLPASLEAAGYAAEHSVIDALNQLNGLVRVVAHLAGYDEATIESWLVEPEMIRVNGTK